MKRTLIVLALLLFAAAPGCDEPREDDGPEVEVIHDGKRAVTCWSYRGGMSCLPDWSIGTAVELPNLGAEPKVKRGTRI